VLANGTAAFVTPTVDGWTLVVLGGQLFDEDGNGRVDLRRLSKEFGEAQKFASHRVVEYQEWQRWVQGSPGRRYCWIGESGEIPFDEGDPLAEEGNILRATHITADWENFDIADEGVVMAVAAAWSVDPTTLDERSELPSTGLVGIVS